MVISTIAIDSSEAIKVKVSAELAEEDKILLGKNYKININFYRYLINDPYFKVKHTKDREILIETEGEKFGTSWLINDHPSPKVNTRSPSRNL